MKNIIMALFATLTFQVHANSDAHKHAHPLHIEHELGVVQFDSPPKNVVTLDWVLTETVLSLGVQPQGIADIKGYNKWVVEPAIESSGVSDVGSRREPNLEVLTELKPDVILISQSMQTVTSTRLILVHLLYQMMNVK